MGESVWDQTQKPSLGWWRRITCWCERQASFCVCSDFWDGDHDELRVPINPYSGYLTLYHQYTVAIESTIRFRLQIIKVAVWFIFKLLLCKSECFHAANVYGTTLCVSHHGQWQTLSRNKSSENVLKESESTSHRLWLLCSPRWRRSSQNPFQRAREAHLYRLSSQLSWCLASSWICMRMGWRETLRPMQISKMLLGQQELMSSALESSTASLLCLSLPPGAHLPRGCMSVPESPTPGSSWHCPRTQLPFCFLAHKKSLHLHC